MKLEGKRVLVFGAGISGIGAADLLCKVGACPVIYDGNDKQDPEAIKARLEQPENVDIILGELSEEARKTLDLVVMSPGVPTDLSIVKTLRTQGLPIWGEVELAYQMGKGKVLAITGTNGKTTTTTLLGQIMKRFQEDGIRGRQYRKPLYPGGERDDGTLHHGGGNEQFPAGDDPGIPPESQRHLKLHAGPSEPASYDGSLCERKEEYREKSNRRRLLHPEL